MIATETLLEAATDPGVFADRVLGRPLWDYQLDLARSTARYRIVCAGRQVGKSATLEAIVLFEAATRANRFILIISATESASRRLLENTARLVAGSDLLRASVVEESKSELRFSNGSRILSIPASEKQVRGWSVDLLVIDEAAFVAEELWDAAEPSIIARPGSRVIMTSTPFGVDHFFRRLWADGMTSPGESVRSWHWPSSRSPLIHADDLDGIRRRTDPVKFRREYEAEWADESGLLLTPDELMHATIDYGMTEPWFVQRQQGYSRTTFFLGQGSRASFAVPPVVMGVDWGAARDSNAFVLVGALDDNGRNVAASESDPGDHVFFVPYLEVHARMPYGNFINQITQAAQGYNVAAIASETNGVGAYPTEELARRLDALYREGKIARFDGDQTRVRPVWTDARRKQTMFGRLKGMLQSGRLVLPRHPELLKQLGSLEMTEMASGSTRIAVPESRGHDDLAMAFGQALSAIGTTARSPEQRYREFFRSKKVETVVELPTGTKVPLPPTLLDPANSHVFSLPAGAERSLPW